jgi:branched-chain amino acid transport system substrate-binding protein
MEIREPMLRRLSCLFFVLACAGCSQQPPQEPILIGHLAPLTGADRIAGEHALQGMQIAVEEVNQPEHLIAGRQIAVLHADTKSDPEMLQAEAVRLITVNRAIALVGGGNSGEVERLGRAVQPYDLSVFTLAKLPSKPIVPSVFSLTPALGTYGTVLAKYAAKELKASRIAILSDGRMPAAGPLIDSFARELQRESGIHLTSWEFKTESELLELSDPFSNFKPTAVLYSGPLTELVRFRSRLKDPQPVWLLAFSEASSLQAELETNPGLVWASPLPPEDASPFARNYAARYQEPPDSAALLAYDAVRVIAAGLRRAPKNAPSRLRDELLQSDPPFECSTGTLTFDAEQKARRPLFIVQLKNGKPVLLKRYEPDLL